MYYIRRKSFLVERLTLDLRVKIVCLMHWNNFCFNQHYMNFKLDNLITCPCLFQREIIDDVETPLKNPTVRRPLTEKTGLPNTYNQFKREPYAIKVNSLGTFLAPLYSRFLVCLRDENIYKTI